MKIGYIITAHTLPEHLVRLVRRLASDNARFFIHVDRRAPDAVMAAIERELGGRPDVRLLPRHPVHWASFGPVRAALEGVRALLESEEPLEYGVLLTGQDYPLRSPEAIESVLADAGGRSFITFRPPEGRFLRRLTRWHWHDICTDTLKRGTEPLPNGSCPRGMRLYGGSEMLHVWFTGDLRSAFAIHAPFGDLCAAGAVPAATCRRGVTRAEM